MSRLVWVGVGAVGGIYVYRKGERALLAVREQGLAGTVQLVAATTLNGVVALRSQPAAAIAPAPVHPQPGLRVGRFRITRTDDTAPATPPAIMDTGLIDLTDPADREPAALHGTREPRRRKAR